MAKLKLAKIGSVPGAGKVYSISGVDRDVYQKGLPFVLDKWLRLYSDRKGFGLMTARQYDAFCDSHVYAMKMVDSYTPVREAAVILPSESAKDDSFSLVLCRDPFQDILPFHKISAAFSSFGFIISPESADDLLERALAEDGRETVDERAEKVRAGEDFSKRRFFRVFSNGQTPILLYKGVSPWTFHEYDVKALGSWLFGTDPSADPNHYDRKYKMRPNAFFPGEYFPVKPYGRGPMFGNLAMTPDGFRGVFSNLEYLIGRYQFFATSLSEDANREVMQGRISLAGEDNPVGRVSIADETSGAVSLTEDDA